MSSKTSGYFGDLVDLEIRLHVATRSWRLGSHGPAKALHDSAQAGDRSAHELPRVDLADSNAGGF